MSFENGYNIKEYIENTILRYDEDNSIFDKAINVLNIYMNRPDWPYCFKEYIDISSDILGDNCEWITKYYFQFRNQQKHFQLLEKEAAADLEVSDECKCLKWDKELSDKFKCDYSTFSKILNPIINQYYDYINNPLGVKSLLRINNNDSMSVLRLTRTDGEYLDLNMHKHDIKQLSSTLLEMIDKEGR